MKKLVNGVETDMTPAEIAEMEAFWALPKPQPSPLEQIRALERTLEDDQNRINRQTALTLALDKAMLLPAAEGKTRAEVHAIYYSTNANYRRLFDLEAQITELRRLL